MKNKNSHSSAINDNLERMAKTLYDYWFVQFDFPDENGKPYKSSGGKMIWNEVLKRNIPEGWEVKQIDRVLKKNENSNRLNAKEYLLRGTIPVIDQGTSFIAGYTNNENLRIKTTRDIPAIIFGDHTRVLKLINFDFVRGADGTQVLLSINDAMPQYLFYHSLLKIDLSNYGYARHFKFLKDSKIIIPHKKVSKLFELNVKCFFDKILNNQLQNQQLSSLCDWLLPMLMNGQVKVE
ncbi:hypothetical protein OF897_04200 [Chryseobacterium formosus]|uniref:Type I restriction modification DNA specificity domain-containing protein n=1 Tax=Chryseobacterium formosus TaxID=1537363 RepID=A0ABT3XP63_9FLAO|nr:hypothetical protein [Chryseobacterium formosus]MCX8523123.1 hypothetical protein [Chryseobacterium formosus]